MQPDEVEGHGEIVSLESKVTRQKEWQQDAAGHDSLGIFGLLALALAMLASTASSPTAWPSGHRRTRHPHCPGSPTATRAQAGPQVRCRQRRLLSGMTAGVLLSFYATKLVAHYRSEVSASEPLLLLLDATPLLFLAAAPVACLLPARRATSI